ncbi:EamA family transporter [Natrialbaceae archaeon A-arb3/5]
MRTGNYILWALLACIAYSFVPPLVRVGTREIPSNVAAFISNFVLLVITFAVLVYNSESLSPHVTSNGAIYLYLAGICLGVGILSYYRALELGPVSIVVPIFAMFIVGGSVIGFVVLNEAVTARKVLGVILGVVAIYLISV